MTPEERAQIKWAADNVALSRLIEVMLDRSTPPSRARIARLAFKLRMKSYQALFGGEKR